MSELSLAPTRTAVLCMDYQRAIVDNHAPDAGTLLGTAARVLTAARSAGARIIYVVVGFREGFPEVSPRNQAFAAVKNRPGYLTGDNARIHEAVAPQAGDITVTKHRVGAFTGTDLEMILRANDIETLVLLGIATSGVVLSTVRQAADADYRLVVVDDGCADADAQVHRCLMDKVFPRQARVVTAEQVCQALQPDR